MKEWLYDLLSLSMVVENITIALVSLIFMRYMHKIVFLLNRHFSMICILRLQAHHGVRVKLTCNLLRVFRLRHWLRIIVKFFTIDCSIVKSFSRPG